MKAVQFSRYGGPEVLQVVDLSVPTPGAGEVLVRLRACGVNYIDTYHRTGLYPVSLPCVPGEEGAGEVISLGAGVTDFEVGDPVAYCSISGSYAEFVSIPAARAVKLPEDFSFESAAALMLQGITAHYLVTTTFVLRQGQTCLVHAAAGGVGLLLVQLAKRAGARVIGTVSTDAKAAIVREAGADHVILYEQEDFAEGVRKYTDGEGVEVVYDSVGKSTFDRSLKCLKPLGYLVLFGQSSGKVDPIDPALLSRGGSLFLTRPTLSNYIADRKTLEARTSELMNLVAGKELKLRIGSTYPLSDAAEAHRSLEGRNTSGKLLLIP